jgi:hypothetical protein
MVVGVVGYVVTRHCEVCVGQAFVGIGGSGYIRTGKMLSFSCC